MDFGRRIAEDLRKEMRPLAESRMRATCKIERPGDVTTDPTTGAVLPTLTQVYCGKCWVTDFNAHPSVFDSVGAQVSINQPTVRLPVSAPTVRVGDQVSITADLDNAQNAGKVFRVVAVRSKGQETARNLICDEIQQGA